VAHAGNPAGGRMSAMAQGLDRYDWARIEQALDAEGWALLPALFTPAQARELAQRLDDPKGNDKAGDIHRLPTPAGQGERASLDAPLPMALAGLQAALHARLESLARTWAQRLGRDTHSLPPALPNPAVIHRLREGDSHPLEYDADDSAFPLRLVALLSAAGHDFTGGEFVMTEQRPRQQSRPLVLPLALGDAALIAAAHRPIRGSQGDYRATLRHAISRVRSGVRVGLELPLGPL